MIPISILDLVRITEEGNPRIALDNALELAAYAEHLGYRRFWVAEHHNMPSIASAATAIVVAHVAAGTKTIRVGAGGVMLPNHSPLVVAEQFGTLAHLYPDRIDLGVGRAPGTDYETSQVLRRHPDATKNFPQDVLELLGFLAPVQPGQEIQAVPGGGTQVPVWILGSSHFGAALAAELGLPFAFASHFSPEHLLPALQVYRSRFKPSSKLDKPYVIISANVIAADSEREARHLATTQQMSFVNMIRGAQTLSPPPIDDIESYWTPAEKRHVMSMLSRSIVGTPEKVRRQVQALVRDTGADELMVVGDIYDQAARLYSMQLIAQALRMDEVEGDQSISSLLQEA